MYRINKYVKPETVEECADIFFSSKRNRFLGGTMFLRMASQVIPTGIDLSGCGLDYIKKDNEGDIHIGAMISLRELEINPYISQYCNGMISKAAGEIIGVQFRNLATVGASVFSKYGFSDIITSLLACKADVCLYKQGRLSLEEFLLQPLSRDLLTEIILPSNGKKGVFLSLRNSKGDYAILNVGLAQIDSQYRIAVGARPSRAALADHAMELLKRPPEEWEIEKVAITAASELTFGSNMRATGSYRSNMCQVLIEEGLVQIQEGGV